MEIDLSYCIMKTFYLFLASSFHNMPANSGQSFQSGPVVDGCKEALLNSNFLRIFVIVI